jgi:hypothetical protein
MIKLTMIQIKRSEKIIEGEWESIKIPQKNINRDWFQEERVDFHWTHLSQPKKIALQGAIFAVAQNHQAPND